MQDMMDSWARKRSPDEQQTVAEEFAKVKAVLGAAPHVMLDFTVPDYLPNRTYRATLLTILDEYNALRIRYEVLPTNEEPSQPQTLRQPGSSFSMAHASGPFGCAMTLGRSMRTSVAPAESRPPHTSLTANLMCARFHRPMHAGLKPMSALRWGRARAGDAVGTPFLRLGSSTELAETLRESSHQAFSRASIH